MTNIEYFQRYKARKENEEYNLELAKKYGYETYDDYEYAMSKQISRDTSFELNQEYYTRCQEYLYKTLKAYYYYKCTNKKELIIGNKTFKLTVYSINELVEALNAGNIILLSYLEKQNINVSEFIREISTENIDVLKLKTI